MFHFEVVESNRGFDSFIYLQKQNRPAGSRAPRGTTTSLVARESMPVACKGRFAQDIDGLNRDPACAMRNKNTRVSVVQLYVCLFRM